MKVKINYYYRKIAILDYIRLERIKKKRKTISPILREEACPSPD